MDENGLVTFGIYEGQPVEALLENRGYCEYLMAKPWFKKDQSELYNLMVARGYEPLGCPAHNALVNRFLDDDFRLAFLRAANPLWLRLRFDDFKQARERVKAKYQQKSAAELQAFVDWDRQDREDGYRVETEIFFERKISDDAKRVFDVLIPVRVWAKWHGREVEIAGMGSGTKAQLTIEVKPDLGEEYPHTMRQMTESGAEYLLLDTYRGKAISATDLRRYFATAGKKLIFLSEVEAQLRPRPAPRSLRLVTS